MKNRLFKLPSFVGFALFLLLLLCLFYNRLLWGQEVLYWRDFSHIYLPLFGFVGEQIAQGQMPWWNPQLFAGHPQAGALEPPLFYPFTWLFALGPAPVIAIWTILLHQLLSGLGAYFVAYKQGWDRQTRWFMGFAFALGASLVSLTNLFPLLWTLAWLPWMLAALIGWMQTRRGRYLQILSLAGALQLLSGHFDMVLPSWFLLFIFAIYLSYPKPDLNAWLGLLSSGLAMLGLASVQLLAAFEMLKISTRQAALPYLLGSLWSLKPIRLFDGWVPNFSGNLQKPAHLMDFLGEELFTTFNANTYLILSFYVGIPVIVLALSSLRQQSKVAWLWGGLAVFFVLLTLGRYTPLHPLAYQSLPGFSLIRFPEKFGLFAAFCVILMAGFGYQQWLAQDTQATARRRIVFAGGSLGALIVALLLTIKLKPQSFTQLVWPLAQKLTPEIVSEVMSPVLDALSQRLIQALLLLGITVLLLWYKSKQSSFSRQPWLLIGLLLVDLLSATYALIWRAPREVVMAASPLQALPHNSESRLTNIEYNPGLDKSLRSKAGSEFLRQVSLYERQSLMDNHGLSADFYLANGDLPIKLLMQQKLFGLYEQSGIPEDLKIVEDLLAIRYISTAANSNRAELMRMQPHVYRLALKQDELNLEVWERIQPSSRFDFFNQTSSLNIAEADELVKHYRQSSNLILSPSTIFEKNIESSRLERKLAWQMNLLNEGPNDLALELNTNSAGYLLIKDNYYQGWKASVDQQSVPLLIANGFQRAIKLDAGKHTVQLKYRPSWLLSGAILAVFGLLIMFLLGKYNSENLKNSEYA